MKHLIALLGIACLAGCLKSPFDGPPRETDVRAYPKILAEWKGYGLVDHFPEEIPENATNVVFFSFPGMLQAGAWIQLRQGLPETEIRRLYDQAQTIARQHHDGGNSTTHMSGTPEMTKSRLASTWFYTSGSTNEDFPRDYRVFIFDATPYKTNSPDYPDSVYYGTNARPDWNHGTSRGVAINTNRNEVIYWAESW